MDGRNSPRRKRPPGGRSGGPRTSVQAPAIRRSNRSGGNGITCTASIRFQLYDPSPARSSAVFGGLDTSTPGRAAAANMRRVLAEAGNKNVTIRLFERANHPLMDAKTGGNAEIPSLKGTVPGLFDTLGAWVMTQLKPRR